MVDRNNHPIWDVYDLLRTSYLNIEYYSARLHSAQKLNFLLEVIIAVTASTSAVAGLYLWSKGIGKEIWELLTVAAAFTATIKPFLKLPDKIRGFQELITDYKAIYADVDTLTSRIKQNGHYTEEFSQNYLDLKEREAEVRKKPSPETKVNEKLRSEVENVVKRRHPKESFYIPDV